MEITLVYIRLITLTKYIMRTLTYILLLCFPWSSLPSVVMSQRGHALRKSGDFSYCRG